MSREGAQAVFGAAIVDVTFRSALLDCPAKAIEGFDLTNEEFRALTSIRASTIQQFAAKFERWRLAKAVGRERPLRSYPEDSPVDERMAG